MCIELESLLRYLGQSKKTLLVTVENQGRLRAEKKRETKGRGIERI